MKNSQRIENLQSYLFDLKRNKKKTEKRLNRLAEHYTEIAEHYTETKNQIKEVEFKLCELIQTDERTIKVEAYVLKELSTGLWKEEAPIDKEIICNRNRAPKWVPPFRPADHTERKFNDGILQHLPKEKIVIPKAEINIFLARHNKTPIHKL